ncbi:hypothetical protein [Hyalangium versicolor]|uniref:hypothetical protein n=1 Tax=Hyalangium versicolor TaxID=2861190 RepID=UPI001CCFEE5A|nr:hypothetical protein [Hyalangium versicolor]
MNPLILGTLLGSVFGLIIIVTKIPRKVEHKRRAMLAAFTSRAAIGFLIAAVSLGTPFWLTGLIVGLLVSIPHGIIAREYHIISAGGIGGAVIGLLLGLWT